MSSSYGHIVHEAETHRLGLATVVPRRSHSDERPVIPRLARLRASPFYNPINSFTHGSEGAKDGLFRSRGEVEVALVEVRWDLAKCGPGADCCGRVAAERLELSWPGREGSWSWIRRRRGRATGGGRPR